MLQVEPTVNELNWLINSQLNFQDIWYLYKFDPNVSEKPTYASP